MELNIILKRDEKQPWGFRLIGGTDFEMPLTVVKVQQQSLSELKGLQNGDSLLSINDKPAIRMSHDEAHDAIVRAGNYLRLQVYRGPFDHLQETGFQPITTNPDIDHMFQPSEVDREFPTDRSATSSPFLITPKPYRPFSTEPIEVPPIESPIILNPGFKDDFPEVDDNEPRVETIFKLPISPQYVPDKAVNRSRGCSRIDFKIEEFKDTSSVIQENIVKEEKCINFIEQNTVEEIKILEQMKQELDITQIEKTASFIVDESIEKAVSVTEEIKKEIDIEIIESSSESVSTKTITETKHELIESSSEAVSSKTTTESKNKEESIKSEIKIVDNSTETKCNEGSLSNISNSQTNIESENKTSQEISQYNEVNNVNEFKETNEFKTKEGKVTTINEHESALAKSKMSEHNEKIVLKENNTKEQVQNGLSTKETQRNSAQLTSLNDKSSIINNNVSARNESQYQLSQKKNVSEHKSIKVQQNPKSQSTTQSSSSTTKKMTTSNLLAEQRAYILGLQTIPNIKGRVHSSYHYDLLLKTFFIHLTDVMVALSRFILLDRPLSKSNSTEDISQEVTENVINTDETFSTNVYKEDGVYIANNIETATEEKAVQNNITLIENQTNSSDLGNNVVNVESRTDNNEIIIQETVEHKKQSGSKMAQMTAKKSEELIHKMDAVVSEFQMKTGLDETKQECQNVELEIYKESDPLEWLSKKDEVNKVDTLTTLKQTQAVSKTETHQTAIQESSITNAEEFKTKSTSKFIENEQTISGMDNAKTYIAIVESHVYTNKDAIIEDKTTQHSKAIEKHMIEEISQSSNKITSQQIEVKEEAEISLEEAIAKSNIAIVTCEPIDRKEINEDKVVISLKSEESEISLINESEHNIVNIQQNITQDEQLTVENVSETNDKLESKIESNVEELVIVSTNVEESQIHKYSEQINSETILKEDNKLESSYAKDESKVTQTAIISSNVDETQIHNLEEVEKMAAEYQNESIMNNESIVTVVQETKEVIQEASFTAKSVNTLSESNETKTQNTEKLKLSLNIVKPEELAKTKFESQISVQSDASSTDIKTPTPSTFPPTPLTDEYVFRLELPLVVSSSGNPDIIEEISDIEKEDHEDPHIVKKKLIPHIETTIESIIYDEPLASPLANNITPAFIEHGLDTTQEKVEAKVISEEEILEIERKSSLLATAIDETIKSIEEYKEQVGIETQITKEVAGQNETQMIENEIVNIQHTDNNLEINKTDQEISHVENHFAVQDSVNIQNQVQTYRATTEVKLNSFAMADNVITSTQNGFTNIQNNDNSFVATQNGSLAQHNVATLESQSTMQNGFASAQNGFVTTQNGFGTAQNGFATNQNGFTSAQNGVTTAQNGFATTQNGFDTTQNGFAITQNVSVSEQHELRESTTTKNNFETTQNMHLMEKSDTNNEFISEIGGTIEGIMNTMEGSTVLDVEVAKELGKPGMTEDKIAELISGESEMLREAHVMGLKRVLASHMNRPDDSSVDFKKLKPIIENLKDSEVLKALNEEIIKTRDEMKKESGNKYTTFLQKPKRPVPKAKYGYCFRMTQEAEDETQEPYRVKIVKQPKPKVAPDYIPEVEDFETGPLPWEERAAKEPPPPPVPREEPILVPEELPEYLEAVDPLPESEVPDLEDTGIPLPPPKKQLPAPQLEAELPALQPEDNLPEVPAEVEAEVEVTEESKEDMEQARIAQEILGTVQNMVDPHATLEQQLGQMRAQLAALAQLPGVIQQTLELVTKQLTTLSSQETSQSISTTCQETVTQTSEHTEVSEEHYHNTEVSAQEELPKPEMLEESIEEKHEIKMEAPSEELEKIRAEEMMLLEEQRRVEKEKKELERLELESRQIKQRPTPRVGKPKPVFGPLTPQERPMVLPGGRKWRSPKDAYNEEFIAETLTAQAEIIQGKAMGLPYESAYLPYDERINFMKYEKPPVSLDHLKNSDVYKLIHNTDDGPVRRVDMLTPVIAECDYREKCRSVTPSVDRMPQ